MTRKFVSVSGFILLGLVSIVGLVWAQDSIADIEFLEFLANWSEEEQYWLEAELDAMDQSDCNSGNPQHTDSQDNDPCTGIVNEKENVQ
ncbi:MAG: hypothetical protein AAF542_23745 [Pseudomonadota bacterium]